ncbi:hypothetical protein B566_EDAN016225 [Ephemera danica]|nr:hypothetical protein B566_EDAN016225 [Ephemera danica]
MEIQESNIPTAGQGVFCDAWIPAHTILGPYEGKLIKNGNNDGGYLLHHKICWQVERDERKNDCIDAEDMRYSNWTRFINAANHMEYQNLEPFQYKGQIFFRTNVDICYVGNKCQFCFLNFTSLLVAQRHVHVRHGSEQSLLVIQYKATVMFPPSKYNMQQLVPASAYPAKRDENGLFVCPVCGKTSKHKHHLNHTMAAHTKERPHECSYCNASFTEKHHLTNHINAIHTHNKPYMCEDCDYKATQKGTLTRHRQAVHLDVRNFACTECSYTSTTSGHFRSHMRIHTGDLFQCPSCD